jgi:acyl-coenzyme A synthetase/AMP-(fatty) acid ligase
VAAHVFTSGSTGEPSAHEKTFGSLVSGSCIAGAALEINRFTGGNLLATVPAQHMYGLESSVLLPLQHGVAFDGGRPFYPADILARLSALPRPRILVTTPVHLRVVLADAGALPELDLLICATAPLFPQLASEAEARFGAPLYEIYGCTEAGQLASRRTTNGAAWKLLEGITLRSDTSRFFAAGGPVEQEAELQDLLEIESDDTFLLHGRRTDLINVGGKRTSLAALNFHLNSIPGVHDGVFVMPDHAPDQLTRLVAFVVAPGVSDAELQLGLRNRIDPAFLPRPLYRVAELPRNTTGKLPRSALTRLVAESAEE